MELNPQLNVPLIVFLFRHPIGGRAVITTRYWLSVIVNKCMWLCLGEDIPPLLTVPRGNHWKGWRGLTRAHRLWSMGHSIHPCSFQMHSNDSYPPGFFSSHTSQWHSGAIQAISNFVTGLNIVPFRLIEIMWGSITKICPSTFQIPTQHALVQQQRKSADFSVISVRHTKITPSRGTDVTSLHIFGWEKRSASSSLWCRTRSEIHLISVK